MNPCEYSVSPFLARALVLGAVERYDSEGGIANDQTARHKVAERLAGNLGCPLEHAYELLADALAERAAETPNNLK